MQRTNILVGVLIAVVGIMMLIVPTECIKIAVIAIGIVAILNGVYILFAERNLVDDGTFKTTLTVRGGASLAVGVCAVLLPLILAGIVWTVMVYIIASFLLLSAASELYSTHKMKAAGLEVKLFTIEMVASALVSLLLFCMPTKIGTAIIRIGGAALLITAAVCFYTEWKRKPLIIQAEILTDDNHD